MRKILFIFFSFFVLSKGMNNDNIKNHLFIKNYEKKSINIIFMLPLFLNSISKEGEIYNRNNELGNRAFSFYIGAKAASDFFLLKRKEKVYIQVFDTKNEKIRIKNFIHSYNFSNIHAIIGPFFRSSLEEVAQKNKKIPIISPFTSSDSLNSYTNVIQAETKDTCLVEPILEKIRIIYKKDKINILYLLGKDPSKRIVNFIKKKLWDLDFKIFHLKKNFCHSNFIVKNIPFFVVFLGGDSFLGKKFVEFIQKNKKIIPFGIGFHDIYYKKISFLKKYKFVFTTKYHFNRNDNKKINMFHFLKKKLGNHLNKYQLIGFDLTLDILNKLVENNNLFEIIDKKTFLGLVSKYQYHKYNEGGYVNKGLWIICL
ncbi:type 1 periplasmic-binding domain-containing protein [Blattabacterium cuenoti]|uniref:hypothetical protein n=1 Tax=Blattabacterium cuenoti TaxID=1653831 RepID=UPI00163C79A1|nr:hypothetical protein [Blattabacterium cuenoti]